MVNKVIKLTDRNSQRPIDVTRESTLLDKPAVAPEQRLAWTPKRVAVFVLTCCLLLFGSTWLVEGLLVPVVVTGGSMTPTLLGAHRHWICLACSFGFDCSLESLPAEGRPAVCPFCGAANPLENGVDRAGQRILIDRFSLLRRPPQRWETVVLRNPEQREQLCIKRLVGMPGETIHIEGGDLFVDGQIPRKRLSQDWSMAVPVSRMTSASGLSARAHWQSAPESKWQFSDGKFVRTDGEEKTNDSQASAAEFGSIDWLTFCRQSCQAGSAATAALTRDDSPCDQSESRVLNDVADILFRCELRAFMDAALLVRAGSGAEEFVVSFDSKSNEGTLTHNGTFRGQFQFPAQSARRSISVILADHRLRVACGDRSLIGYYYDPATTGPRGARLAVGARGSRVELARLEVFRDIYYLPGTQSGESVNYQLGADEYFLLGDNSPHSTDSRAWLPVRHVTRSDILGIARAW